MNPYAIVIALVVFGLSVFGAEHRGESRGAAIQAHADQVQLDAVNRGLEQQTAQANQLRHDLDAAAIAKAAADAQLHQQQEDLHAKDLALTEEHRRALARADDGRLRVAVAIPDGACRRGGGGDVPAGAHAAGAATTAVVELPGPVAQALRDLVFDADQLADDYRQCRRWVYPHDAGAVSGPPAPTTAAPDISAADHPSTVEPTTTTTQDSKP